MDLLEVMLINLVSQNGLVLDVTVYLNVLPERHYNFDAQLMGYKTFA